jgi:flagellar motor component MotA
MTDAEAQALQDRVKVLERIIEVMAGYIPGFGVVAMHHARSAAIQHIAETRAATERFNIATCFGGGGMAG